MASVVTAANEVKPHSASHAVAAALVVSLPSMPREGLDGMLATLAGAFPGNSVLVATPDAGSADAGSSDAGPAAGAAVVGSAAGAAAGGLIRVVGYTPAAPSPGSWTLVAADFLNTYELVKTHGAKAALLLGAEASSLRPEALRSMADAVLQHNADLAVPRYELPPRAGLVNSAILYPVSRALFGAMPRFPLALDLGMSARMAMRLGATAQRFTATNQPEALLWPVMEAAVGNYAIVQVETGSRTIPQPPNSGSAADLNAVLAHVTGSLFAEVDAKAAFWQRARVAPAARPLLSANEAPDAADEVKPMLDSFRIAYTNLHEIWSLVLPPHSLLGLKRLSVMAPESFAMPDSLWARIVYDFLLAYRLRSINRGHLLGALTPLYLAWVASHILQTSAGDDPERHIEAVAAAFEADKPYLVSRWRWPDRFNP